MNARLIKLVVLWNVALTAVLLVSLLANAAFVQASNDPPVQVFTSSPEDLGGGRGTGGGVTLDSTSYKVLASITTNNLSDAHKHVCLATGTANVLRYGTGSGFSNYGMSMDDTSSVQSPSRMSLLFETEDLDAAAASVASTYGFTNVQGAHTFYFLGAKSADSATNVTVNNSSMTLVCMKKNLH